jgi:ribosomal protein S28E/S33
LKNRNSFDDLTLWVNYVRDVCLINRTIYIFGNYQAKGSILTLKCDIDDLIDKQKIIARYFEVGNRRTDDIITLFDEIIEMTYEEEKNLNKSSSKEKCLIF